MMNGGLPDHDREDNIPQWIPSTCSLVTKTGLRIVIQMVNMGIWWRIRRHESIMIHGHAGPSAGRIVCFPPPALAALSVISDWTKLKNWMLIWVDQFWWMGGSSSNHICLSLLNHFSQVENSRGPRHFPRAWPGDQCLQCCLQHPQQWAERSSGISSETAQELL